MPTEISSEKCVVRFMVSRNFGLPAEYLVRAFSLEGEIEQFVKDLSIYVYLVQRVSFYRHNIDIDWAQVFIWGKEISLERFLLQFQNKCVIRNTEKSNQVLRIQNYKYLEKKKNHFFFLGFFLAPLNHVWKVSCVQELII